MSSECEVTYQDEPIEVENQVLQILSRCGYECEFAPNTRLLSSETEYVLLRVSGYPSPKPRVRPERTFLVQVGIGNITPAQDGTHKFGTRTTSGRSRLEFALQVLIAAAVAEITVGELFDPQQDKRLAANTSVAYALSMLQSREPPHDLREREFTSWPAWA